MLRDRLGEDGSFALLEWLESEHTNWSEDVLTLAGERFERRLVQEASALRVGFRDDLAALRTEMHGGFATLRVEVRDVRAGLREEMAGLRVDLFKWSFMFWIGQVAAMAGLLAFMLRGVRF